MTVEGTGEGQGTPNPDATGTGTGEGTGETGPSAEALTAARERAAADKVVADEATAAAAAEGGTGEAGNQAGGNTTPRAPETYALTMPEGIEDLQADIEGTARAQDWTNEQAQTYANGLPAHYQEQGTRYMTELEADPELGGERLDGVKANIKRTLDKYLPADTPDGGRLRRDLNLTGFGNYAPLAKLLARIGAAHQEDRPNMAGAPRPAGEKSTEDLFYDNPSSKAG